MLTFLLGIVRPKPVLSEEEVRRGLSAMTWEGATSLSMLSVTTSGILVAFALALGANNFQIGVLAAIPFVTQILQIPAIPLIDRVRRRKAIALLTWLPAQLLWIPIAFIPVILKAPSGQAIAALLVLLATRGVFSAVTSCAWNGWVRDLVPRDVLGRFFSRRLAIATSFSAVFALVGAGFIDFWTGAAEPATAVFGYSIVLGFGAIFLGLASPAFMAMMPEPLMRVPAGPQPPLWRVLAAPFRNHNYRQLISFLFFWGFALNLAVPFFAVYMLQRVGLPIAGVIALSILSQMANITFIRVWGPLADRFGSKVVLSVSASLYLLVIIGWTFTTMPERYALSIPLLVVLHVFAGIAAAGVTLTVGTIGLKLAPEGESTAYLAASSLAANLGAGLAPLLGGLFVDYFSVRELTIGFTWADPDRQVQFSTLHLTGYDFLFAFAFVLGLITLNTLTTVREEGEMGREVVLGELLAQTQWASRAVSSVPGLRFVTSFPYAYLRHVPGMDVALGVTAYEVASLTQRASEGVAHGRTAARDVSRRVQNALRGLADSAEGAASSSTELARHAVRGVMHSAEGLERGGGDLARGAVTGVLRALSRSVLDPEAALWAAGYGVIEGGAEAKVDLAMAGAQAVKGARAAAANLNVSEETAVAQVVSGLLEAARAVGPDAVATVESVVPAANSEPRE